MDEKQFIMTKKIGHYINTNLANLTDDKNKQIYYNLKAHDQIVEILNESFDTDLFIELGRTEKILKGYCVEKNVFREKLEKLDLEELKTVTKYMEAHSND